MFRAKSEKDYLSRKPVIVDKKQDQVFWGREVTSTVDLYSPETLPGNWPEEKAWVGPDSITEQIPDKGILGVYANEDAMHGVELNTVLGGEVNDTPCLAKVITQSIEQLVEVDHHVTVDILLGCLGLDKDKHLHDTSEVDEDVHVHDTLLGNVGVEPPTMHQSFNKPIMWVSTSPKCHNVIREQPVLDSKHGMNTKVHG
ncbi:hypothetical protein L1987_01182 [Smallanthus sonchifolius]|uniref:Uncharacterized protein n=1 Tax=Smallanthus sonchifolius TaxID=185202 RepID=A0ACB9K4D7_9ASTR|nr:hypothetical protein L1987_01182 [Smallanthus sonchifolius]